MEIQKFLRSAHALCQYDGHERRQIPHEKTDQKKHPTHGALPFSSVHCSKHEWLHFITVKTTSNKSAKNLSSQGSSRHSVSLIGQPLTPSLPDLRCSQERLVR